MRRFINPLHFWFAHSNRADLIRQMEFLKEENRVLRSKLPKQIRLTPAERERIIKYGRLVGPAIKDLLTVVSISTFYRWLRGGVPYGRRKTGRPRTPEMIEKLVVRIARETGWGYTRILGELKKLGMCSISRNTVKRILRRHGLEPGPERGEGTWDDFIKRHAETLWQCDFLPRRILTFKGWRDAYILIFINVRSRRVWVSKSTIHPTGAWTATQARLFCDAVRHEPNAPTIVMRDRDRKFTREFDAALRSVNVTPIPTQHCSPNMNAYVERFIQSLQKECLNHFLIFGRRHFDHLINEYLEHYHHERPHQGRDNRLLFPRDGPRTNSARSTIACEERLGGLLKHYVRQAA